MAERRQLHLAVALDGAGWHPGAWREEGARPAALQHPGYWVDLARRAEMGLLDLVTFEDSFGVTRASAGGPLRTDRVQGRLDAVLIAARTAPATRAIGLVPTVSATHTEPFHVSKAIATLDWVSKGRAGVRVQVSPRPDDARHLGRRDLQDHGAGADDLLTEAEDHVEVQRRLWDSWEDDAEIRDVATGRFIDRDKLHYIDFEGPWFSVRGPSITPRPPQGQPLVVALAHTARVRQLAARVADIGLITPVDAMDAESTALEVAGETTAAGRSADEVTVLADLTVVLGRNDASAASRKDRLDDLAGEELRSDATTYVGTPTGLADLIEEWVGGALAGFRLRPAGLPYDLDLIVEDLVPELQSRGLFRRRYEEATLRGRFGLSRPANRYATAGGTSRG